MKRSQISNCLQKTLLGDIQNSSPTRLVLLMRWGRLEPEFFFLCLVLLHLFFFVIYYFLYFSQIIYFFEVASIWPPLISWRHSHTKPNLKKSFNTCHTWNAFSLHCLFRGESYIFLLLFAYHSLNASTFCFAFYIIVGSLRLTESSERKKKKKRNGRSKLVLFRLGFSNLIPRFVFVFEMFPQ